MKEGSLSDMTESAGEEGRKEEHAVWTKEQDASLQTMVEIYGTRDWNIIADDMNSKFVAAPKSAKQCRLRWQKHIHPSLAKHHWSEKQEAELLLAHQLHGNKWSEISNDLKGRNNNSIKNRFYTIFRKVKNKVKKDDFTFVSRCELLQIHYIISVMESYLQSVPTAEASTSKSGKDFIYKLVQHIDGKMLETYKKKFEELTKGCGTMEELFKELVKEEKTVEPAKIALPSEEDKQQTSQVEPEAEDQDEKMKDAHCTPIGAPMRLYSKDTLLANYYHPKDCSPLESMMLGPISPNPVPKYSPCVLSAGPAAAAAAAANAPCFQADPDNLGFSEFTESAKELEATESIVPCPAHRPPVITISPEFSNAQRPQIGLVHANQMSPNAFPIN